VIGIGAGIVRGDAVVGYRIRAQHILRLGKVAEQLGLGPREARLDCRIAGLVPGRVGLVGIGQRVDAVGCHRVGAVEFVTRFRTIAVAEFKVLKPLEELDRTLAGDPRLRQILCACGVCRGFLRTVVGQILAHGRLLAGHDHAHRGIGPARCGSRCAKKQGE